MDKFGDRGRTNDRGIRMIWVMVSSEKRTNDRCTLLTMSLPRPLTVCLLHVVAGSGSLHAKDFVGIVMLDARSGFVIEEVVRPRCHRGRVQRNKYNDKKRCSEYCHSLHRHRHPSILGADRPSALILLSTHGMMVLRYGIVLFKHAQKNEPRYCI